MSSPFQRNPARVILPVTMAGIVFLATGEPLGAQAAIVGSGLATEGTGPLGIGALVGAMVAGAAALRERFKRK